MENSQNDIGELQKIQFQIAQFIDKYRAESETEALVHQLKEAVTNLNSAKVILMDREVAAGAIQMHHSSEQAQEG